MSPSQLLIIYFALCVFVTAFFAVMGLLATRSESMPIEFIRDYPGEKSDVCIDCGKPMPFSYIKCNDCGAPVCVMCAKHTSDFRWLCKVHTYPVVKGV